MGFGDPDHQHPLNLHCLRAKEATCFRCGLPIKRGDWCYGCARCDHFVHQVCFELPCNMNHPLHRQHPLTLLPSSGSQMDCSRCHDPCLSGYTYQCEACLDQFSLHLKCFLTHNLEEKHEHPLSLHEVDINDRYKVTCRTCGLLVDDIDSYYFACEDCMFFIHFDCAFLPPTVKRHHVHELTFRYNYPEESDLAYCDVCEDKDGKELDRTLSYYYCKRCDYIAHVHCVTTKPAIVTAQLENFVPEHPMIYSQKPTREEIACACHDWPFLDSYYFCSQYDYKLLKSCAKFPRLIKHPRHKDHALSLAIAYASGNTEGELSVCSFCSGKMDDGALILQCLDCDYTEHLCCAVCFRHPHHVANLWLLACDNRKFRCNACGELGDGYRFSDNDRTHGIQYDLHLECYALPGKVDRGCHSHPLDLIYSPTKIGSDLSTMFRCDICHHEADPDLWIYSCKQCNYIAHMKCVVGDLLSGVGPSNNFSSICSIAECQKEQFAVKPNESICSKLKAEVHPFGHKYPIFKSTGFFEVTDSNKSFIDELHCPECEQPIPTQAYSSITDREHHSVKANMFNVNNQTPKHHEPLALLDENLVDKLYCPICNQLIFPPTYSCPECQIFFHKSCAELPRKYTTDPGHTFVFLPPSMRIKSLSNCACCKHRIKGYAYVCQRCKTVLDVVCALGAPLHKLENQKHSFYSWRARHIVKNCKACDDPFSDGSIFFKCGASDCSFYLHFECALLPYIVSHGRIHEHPLVLEPHLDLSVDDYVCDACEKHLNPCLWAYRCSDSCDNLATSHVSCIVTSNKKCHFKYDKECTYPRFKKKFTPRFSSCPWRSDKTKEE